MSMATNISLCAVPVFFATSEGQTQKIAGRFAAVLRDEGIASATYDVSDLAYAVIDWTAVRGAIVGASIHVGKHQPVVHAFVSAHAARLNRVPSVFFSVSLAAASKNPGEVQKAQEIANAFPAAHGWRPQAIISLAGRLAYSQYNVLIRFVMKRIARKEGAPTDASRDYEFTNWTRVEQLAKDFAQAYRKSAAA
jgi:menaquinone-dependent protoporphyrinogen oxidase